VPLLEVDDELWQRYWDVNVMSAIRLTRGYIAGMRSRGWGRVQFMASDSAVVIPEEMVHYGVTKTALLGVSRGFAKFVTEYRPTSLIHRLCRQHRAVSSGHLSPHSGEK
jgi:NAD(P)-dependent dehydrogenase (short-subunit alcohol dehydrogenase family)